MPTTELETLIVRMKGDSNHLVNEYKKAEQSTERLGMSMMSTRHSAHLLAATGIIPEGAVRQVMLAMHSFHLLHGAMEGLGRVNKAAWLPIGIGVGAAVAALALLTHALEQLDEEFKLMQEAAKAGFDEMKRGATIEEAQFKRMMKLREAKTDEFTSKQTNIALQQQMGYWERFGHKLSALVKGDFSTAFTTIWNQSNRAIENFGKMDDAIEKLLESMKGIDQAIQPFERLQWALGESKKVFEEMMTPIEQYNKRIEELNFLMESGALGKGAQALETYNRAVAKAQHRLEGAAHAAGGLRQALVGSADERSRIEAYVDLMRPNIHKDGLAQPIEGPGIGPSRWKPPTKSEADEILGRIEKLIIKIEGKMDRKPKPGDPDFGMTPAERERASRESQRKQDERVRNAPPAKPASLSKQAGGLWGTVKSMNPLGLFY